MNKKITNQYDLPHHFYEGIKKTFDKYDRGEADYSVTELISPPHQKALQNLHKDEVSEEAIDLIWALLGTSVHQVLENIEKAPEEINSIVEQRYEVMRLGKCITGQIDLFDKMTKTIWDWKVTSGWSATHGPKAEWTAQLNLLRLIMINQNVNWEIDELKILCIYRDWSKNEAKRSADYPQKQVGVFSIDVWDNTYAEEYLLERINSHQEAYEACRANKQENCTKEERWHKDDIWAIMKNGAKRATKLFGTEQEAIAYVADASPEGLRIEQRPGADVRCDNYCNVNKYCQWYQNQQTPF